MKFALIDKVVELTPGERIVATKNVALAEEYLQDHFPAFPVLPGVFMVQALVEAASWLVRVSEGFRPEHSLITLAEVRNMKYASFLAPGDQMRVEVTARKIEPDASEFAGVGACGDRVVVQGRFSLRHGRVADVPGSGDGLDESIVARLAKHWKLIAPSPAAGAAAARQSG